MASDANKVWRIVAAEDVADADGLTVRLVAQLDRFVDGGGLWLQVRDAQHEPSVQQVKDGKFQIVGQLRFLDGLITMSAKLYADLSKIAEGAATILFLADIPDDPKILTLQDRNAHSPTYGCFDRNFWHYKIIDFPSGMAAEFVWPLALALVVGIAIGFGSAMLLLGRDRAAHVEQQERGRDHQHDDGEGSGDPNRAHGSVV